MRLTLASSSPRRAELLAAAGFAFDVRPVEVDETPLGGEEAAAYVLRLAVLKAQSCECDHGQHLVLAADTTVVVDGELLGKPADDADARRMLRRLSGREHQVLTGVALRLGDRIASAVETTAVRFLPLTDAEIEWYVASREPHDKAGGYAVQGLAARFVDRIEGSYSNVVGLPVSRVYLMMKELVSSRTTGASSADRGPAAVEGAGGSGVLPMKGRGAGTD